MSKITRAKWTEDVAQAVACLFSQVGIPEFKLLKSVLLSFCFAFGGRYKGLNSGPHLLYHLATLPILFFPDGFFQIVLQTIYLGLALNHDLPDVCLLSS
jgi:hypothetical protein